MDVVKGTNLTITETHCRLREGMAIVTLKLREECSVHLVKHHIGFGVSVDANRYSYWALDHADSSVPVLSRSVMWTHRRSLSRSTVQKQNHLRSPVVRCDNEPHNSELSSTNKSKQHYYLPVVFASTGLCWLLVFLNSRFDLVVKKKHFLRNRILMNEEFISLLLLRTRLPHQVNVDGSRNGKTLGKSDGKNILTFPFTEDELRAYFFIIISYPALGNWQKTSIQSKSYQTNSAYMEKNQA